MIRGRGWAALALVACALALCPSSALAQGCAMCGTAVQNPHDPLARSMASSIYFMLSMPFLLFFAVGGWLSYRFYRTARRTDVPAETQRLIHEENPS